MGLGLRVRVLWLLGDGGIEGNKHGNNGSSGDLIGAAIGICFAKPSTVNRVHYPARAQLLQVPLPSCS